MAGELTERDLLHLQRTVELAEGGRGRVSPNPLVGAVIARGGGFLGEGFHAELGGLHAERAALADARDRGHDPAGATAYVSLEPCAHHGRQPPCTDALIEAKVARVVYLADDPSEKASGRGPALLREAGIEVTPANSSAAAAARLQNQPFRKHARSGRPLVILKSAVSLDGRTATGSGDSRWISGAESRALVHAWRADADAVAVGFGTALADDPLLTARDVVAAPSRQPLRVVFDSQARLPLDSALVGSLSEAPVLVIAGADAPGEALAALREAGVDVFVAEGRGADVVSAALAELGRRGITSLLLEGGAGLAGSFLDAGEIDELRLFVAPILVGGENARPLLTGSGAGLIAEARRALAVEHERVGDDVMIHARIQEW
jgi:diaminohydroxyphosphoribosylaminopyrimidine deaminase/5-amino-6-(5-phosphoribosylamino)uracil reductase